MSRIDFFLVLLMAVCLYSVIKGGQPEQRAVVIFVVGIVLTFLAPSPSVHRFTHPEVGILIVDLVILSAFAMLALSAERYWTIWICSMQVIQVLSHIPMMFIPDLLPLAYYVIAAFWVYPMLIVLTIGTYRHQQRLRRFGVDRSWSDFSSSPR
ncbi:MAG: hypothetical protein GW808_13340 [Sphingomonadales bacterium]|nr:hypothetical protein [Sphingomonadales bacterium]NCO50233.1 hypothetical protein [Sphingomonadales bacterium]NCP00495.1 hypothetical protein [Sphingomonadales bacterium]NCP43974.1 hypothetical protein [Sphingomonadales bacterium]NCQ10160.1 hypothetical protein [Sphingomonadales bacterium]